MNFNIDSLRRFYLSIAEATDAWRVVPRLLVTGYGVLLYNVVTWYSELKPYMLEGCTSDVVQDCLVAAPTTQHAALVTAVVGVAAAFFGLYTSSGQKWDRYIFRKWNTKDPLLPDETLYPDDRTDQTESAISQYSKRNDAVTTPPHKTDVSVSAPVGQVGAPPIKVGSVGAPPPPHYPND